MPLLTNRNSYNNHKNHHYLSVIFLLLVVTAVVGAVLDKQNIVDWWRLRGYQPPVAITTLASQDTMTPYALKVFEVNHPQIENKTTFNVECPNDGGEQTIVLGCYHSNQDGIFLLSVDDPLLNGVQQVTAAHEMLHAAYDRLSTSERNYVDGMLLNYFNHDLHDPRILATMAAYKKTEPNAVVNEMHSVFGTEIANLPAPLEQYYTRYFTDRQQITNYAAMYETEFTTRQNTVTTDDSQLTTMKNQINSLETKLGSDLSAVSATQDQLNDLKSGNNIPAYNAAIPGYNQQVNSYNAEVDQLKTLIANYNTLVATRNSVALEEDQLSNELNSSVTTIR